MLQLLKTLWRKREARRLNRDSRVIIEADEATYNEQHLARIAAHVKELLTFAQTSVSGDDSRQVTTRLKEFHAQARKRHDQAALSGGTLAIIRLRAGELGAEAAQAQARIDGFVAKWSQEEDAARLQA